MSYHCVLWANKLLFFIYKSNISATLVTVNKDAKQLSTYFPFLKTPKYVFLKLQLCIQDVGIFHVLCSWDELHMQCNNFSKLEFA